MRATRDVTAAVADAAQRGELNAVQLAAVEDNLKDAPLTAQMVAQGRLKPHQVLDPAEVASYEQALTEQRVKVDREGRETVKRDTRLAAQPVLTRYVEDADSEVDPGCVYVSDGEWIDVVGRGTCCAMQLHVALTTALAQSE